MWRKGACYIRMVSKLESLIIFSKYFQRFGQLPDKNLICKYQQVSLQAEKRNSLKDVDGWQYYTNYFFYPNKSFSQLFILNQKRKRKKSQQKY